MTRYKKPPIPRIKVLRGAELSSIQMSAYRNGATILAYSFEPSDEDIPLIEPGEEFFIKEAFRVCKKTPTGNIEYRHDLVKSGTLDKDDIFQLPSEMKPEYSRFKDVAFKSEVKLIRQITLSEAEKIGIKNPTQERILRWLELQGMNVQTETHVVLYTIRGTKNNTMAA